MQSVHAVVTHADRVTAEQLAADLEAYFRRISIAKDVEELRSSIVRDRAQLAVVDLELLNTQQLHNLCEAFPGTAVVCVHRIPDEFLWMEAIKAGALDCCHPSDTKNILNALRSRPRRKFSAVAA